MPRKSEIQRPTSGMRPKRSTAPRRHTYTSSGDSKNKNNNNTTSGGDLFAFSMHGVDPTVANYFDELYLASPTANDMYLDSIHGDDNTMHSAVGSLPLFSLHEENDGEQQDSTRNKSALKRSKSKKKLKRRKSKRLSIDSESSKKSTDSSKTKSSSRTSSKSKKSSKEAPEEKCVAAMLKKLEEYEESLQEERRLLQKERESITLERETLELKMFELESKLDELEDNSNNHCLAPSSHHINNDALRIENAILQRRVQRQDEIILQLSNTDRKTKKSKEISRLEKELQKEKDLNAKNEKIIKGQKLTIERVRKESSSNGNSHVAQDNNTCFTDDDHSISLFSIEIVGTPQKNKVNHHDFDNDDDSYTTFAESTFEDSLSSLHVTQMNSSRTKVEKQSSSRSLGKIKKWVNKRGKTNSQREAFRNRIVTPEEIALSSLVDSI